MGKSITLIFIIIPLGCALTPKQIHVYDEDCNITYKQLTLEHTTLSTAIHCDNEACIAAFIAVPVISALVSGSIVIVGNIIYWMEKESNCLLKTDEKK